MTDAVATRPTARQRVADHARRVPTLNWKLLTIFLLIGLAGAALYVYGATGRPPASGAGPATPAGTSGFVGLSAPTGASDSPAADSWTA